MEFPLRVPPAIQDILVCPVCKTKLHFSGDSFTCSRSACAARFPIVNGVPILINEENSVFSIADFINQRDTFFDTSHSAARKSIAALIPGISKNYKAKQNYHKFTEALLQQSSTPRLLVVGGSLLGEGMQSLTAIPQLTLVETDVALASRLMLVCDAHDVPFEDASFDGVIAQAVLEHVVDPQRCVAEFHRVLKDDGLVYAETPFMQQVHGGRYDFTRFTHLGHRRLFRYFSEVESGAVGGSGMALAWAYQYFLLSFARSKPLRSALKAFAHLSAFYLKYFDAWLIDKPATLDAASGYYFIGRKAQVPLPDKELIRQYRGLN